MCLNRKRIAESFERNVARGSLPPCFTPDYSEESKLYQEFGGLNEIAIAQQHQQYKSVVDIHLQHNETPPSPFNGCDDSVIMDNILPKHISTQELAESAYHNQDLIRDEWKSKSD